MPAFSSFEAAAAFFVAFFVALLCSPGSGLQLPLVPGCLPGVGSKPGQQGLPLLADFLPEDFFADFFEDFFAVVIAIRKRPLRQMLLTALEHFNAIVNGWDLLQ